MSEALKQMVAEQQRQQTEAAKRQWNAGLNAGQAQNLGIGQALVGAAGAGCAGGNYSPNRPATIGEVIDGRIAAMQSQLKLLEHKRRVYDEAGMLGAPVDVLHF